jgi:hypothetical protein
LTGNCDDEVGASNGQESKTVRMAVLDVDGNMLHVECGARLRERGEKGGN